MRSADASISNDPHAACALFMHDFSSFNAFSICLDEFWSCIDADWLSTVGSADLVVPVSLDAGSKNLSALLIKFSCAMAELGFCMEYLTPSTNFGMTSATDLHDSISSSCVAWLVLCDPAP